MKHISHFLAKALLIGLCLALLPLAAQAKQFLMFDGTLYSGKPNLATQGLLPMTVIYQSSYWKRGQNIKQLPPREQVLALGKTIPAKGDYLTVDVEHWKLDNVSDIEIVQNIERYKAIVKWTREAFPGKKIGIFGRLPIWDNYRCNTEHTSARYLQWQAANKKLKPLAEVVDIIMPELYATSPDMEAWRRIAVEQIEAAKAYNRPVIVYLWFEYWDLDKKGLDGKDLSPEFWRFQLETIYKYADGIIVWGGYGKNKPLPWRNDFVWWKVTKDFMQEKGLGKK
ncbi:MAG: hypothetical protein KKF77_11275 [Proteobacteria bacterium]|nr:hypothetical protein [Pseudomonadota bacterium]